MNAFGHKITFGSAFTNPTKPDELVVPINYPSGINLGDLYYERDSKLMAAILKHARDIAKEHNKTGRTLSTKVTLLHNWVIFRLVPPKRSKK